MDNKLNGWCPHGVPGGSMGGCVQCKAAADNSRYVAELEEDYRILNRMGGALEGCRAELALVIEHLNAAKAPHCT